MCGEKALSMFSSLKNSGSPPHVRGKDVKEAIKIMMKRITPACAGKSLCISFSTVQIEDHPRMCGEKSPRPAKAGLLSGSPPHVRGKAIRTVYAVFPLRITPACAGKRLKRSRSTVPHAAIVPLFPSVCNKPAGSDGSPAGHDAPPFLPIENAVPASPAYNLRSL